MASRFDVSRTVISCSGGNLTRRKTFRIHADTQEESRCSPGLPSDQGVQVGLLMCLFYDAVTSTKVMKVFFFPVQFNSE